MAKKKNIKDREKELPASGVTLRSESSSVHHLIVLARHSPAVQKVVVFFFWGLKYYTLTIHTRAPTPAATVVPFHLLSLLLNFSSSTCVLFCFISSYKTPFLYPIQSLSIFFCAYLFFFFLCSFSLSSPSTAVGGGKACSNVTLYYYIL